MPNDFVYVAVDPNDPYSPRLLSEPPSSSPWATLSRRGLTVGKDLVSTSSFMRERERYNVILSLRVFSSFRLWKTLASWRLYCTQRKRSLVQRRLQWDLLWLSLEWRPLYLQLGLSLDRLSRGVSVVVDVSRSPIDIFELLQAQRAFHCGSVVVELRKIIQDLGQNLALEAKKIFASALRTVPEVKTCNGAQSHTEKNAVKLACVQLKKFIRYCDFRLRGGCAENLEARLKSFCRALVGPETKLKLMLNLELDLTCQGQAPRFCTIPSQEHIKQHVQSVLDLILLGGRIPLFLQDLDSVRTLLEPINANVEWAPLLDGAHDTHSGAQRLAMEAREVIWNHYSQMLHAATSDGFASLLEGFIKLSTITAKTTFDNLFQAENFVIDEMLGEVTVIHTSAATFPTRHSFGVFELDARDVIKIHHGKYQTAFRSLKEKLVLVFSAKARAFCAKIEPFTSALSRSAFKLDEYIKALELYRDCVKKRSDWSVCFDTVAGLRDVLEKFFVVDSECSPTQFGSSWFAFGDSIDNFAANRTEDTKVAVIELSRRAVLISDELTEILLEFIMSPKLSSFSASHLLSPSHVVDKIDSTSFRLERIMIRAKEVDRMQIILGCDVFNLKTVIELSSKMCSLRVLWHSLDRMQVQRQILLETRLDALSAEDFHVFIKRTEGQVSRNVLASLHPALEASVSEMLRELKRDVAVATSVAIVTELKGHEAAQRKDVVGELLGCALDLDTPGLTIGSIVSAAASLSEDKCQDLLGLGELAKVELELLTKSTSVVRAAMQLTIGTSTIWKFTSLSFLYEVEFRFQCLLDSLKTCLAWKRSRDHTQLFGQIISDFHVYSRQISVMVQLHESYVSLRAVFANSKTARLLSKAVEGINHDFQVLKAAYEKIVEMVENLSSATTSERQHAFVINVLALPEFPDKKQLEHATTSGQRANLGLQNYIQTLQSEFPALYQIRRDRIILVLSTIDTAESFELVREELFPFVSSIILDDYDPTKILGISSFDETFLFRHPVSSRASLAEWLSAIDSYCQNANIRILNEVSSVPAEQEPNGQEFSASHQDSSPASVLCRALLDTGSFARTILVSGTESSGKSWLIHSAVNSVPLLKISPFPSLGDLSHLEEYLQEMRRLALHPREPGERLLAHVDLTSSRQLDILMCPSCSDLAEVEQWGRAQDGVRVILECCDLRDLSPSASCSVLLVALPNHRLYSATHLLKHGVDSIITAFGFELGVSDDAARLHRVLTFCFEMYVVPCHEFLCEWKSSPRVQHDLDVLRSAVGLIRALVVAARLGSNLFTDMPDGRAENTLHRIVVFACIWTFGACACDTRGAFDSFFRERFHPPGAEQPPLKFSLVPMPGGDDSQMSIFNCQLERSEGDRPDLTWRLWCPKTSSAGAVGPYDAHAYCSSTSSWTRSCAWGFSLLIPTTTSSSAELIQAALLSSCTGGGLVLAGCAGGGGGSVHRMLQRGLNFDALTQGGAVDGKREAAEVDVSAFSCRAFCVTGARTAVGLGLDLAAARENAQRYFLLPFDHTVAALYEFPSSRRHAKEPWSCAVFVEDLSVANGCSAEEASCIDGLRVWNSPTCSAGGPRFSQLYAATRLILPLGGIPEKSPSTRLARFLGSQHVLHLPPSDLSAVFRKKTMFFLPAAPQELIADLCLLTERVMEALPGFLTKQKSSPAGAVLALQLSARTHYAAQELLLAPLAKRLSGVVGLTGGELIRAWLQGVRVLGQPCHVIRTALEHSVEATLRTSTQDWQGPVFAMTLRKQQSLLEQSSEQPKEESLVASLCLSRGLRGFRPIVVLLPKTSGAGADPLQSAPRGLLKRVAEQAGLRYRFAVVKSTHCVAELSESLALSFAKREDTGRLLHIHVAPTSTSDAGLLVAVWEGVSLRSRHGLEILGEHGLNPATDSVTRELLNSHLSSQVLALSQERAEYILTGTPDELLTRICLATADENVWATAETEEIDESDDHFLSHKELEEILQQSGLSLKSELREIYSNANA